MEPSSHGRADPSVTPDALMDTLAQVSFAFTAELSKVGSRSDLSLTQLRALAILHDRRLRMSELADYLGLEKSTMSGLIDRAEKRGLVQRAPGDGDRRAVDVFLTPEGTALADRLRGEVRAWFRGLTQGLSASDERRLQELLGVLLGASGSAPPVPAVDR
ncbi:MAG: MarR family transcriptional regulator [Brevundimonas sp.]